MCGVALAWASDDKIKRVEEMLAKYKTVDEAMTEIRKLSLEGYKLRETANNDPKKIINENELERYLAKGWDVQTVLPSGKTLIEKQSKIGNQQNAKIVCSQDIYKQLAIKPANYHKQSALHSY